MPARTWRASGIDFSYMLSTRCPTCGAGKGQPCRIYNKKRGGRRTTPGEIALWPHRARRNAYIAREQPPSLSRRADEPRRYAPRRQVR